MPRRLPLVFLLVSAACSAQVPPPPPQEPVDCREWCEFVYCVASEPEPIIGRDSLLTLVRSSPYPVGGDGAAGRVLIAFVVQADGSTDSFEVSRSVSPVLDSAAIRLAQSLAWRPSRRPCDGEAVPSRYALPVSFRPPE